MRDAPVSPEPGAEQLTIAVLPSDAGEPAQLRAAGELDVESAPGLRAAIEQSVASGATVVELDLSGIEFIDSTGISVLLAARELLAGVGTLVLAARSGVVDRALELTGLSELFARQTARDPDAAGQER